MIINLLNDFCNGFITHLLSYVTKDCVIFLSPFVLYYLQVSQFCGINFVSMFTPKNVVNL